MKARSALLAVAATLAAGALFNAASPASAQVRVSMGTPGGGPGPGPVISKAALKRYEGILKLDGPQAEAAAALHEGYMATSSAESKKLQRRLRELEGELKDGEMAGPDGVGGAMALIPQAIGKHGEESGKLTKGFLDDLKALLTPAQVEQHWPALERYRRRASWLRTGPVSGSGVDLIEVVGRMGLGPEQVAALRGTLDQYETDVDRLLVEREREAGEGGKKAGGAAGGARMVFDPAEFAKQADKDRAEGMKVRDLNTRYARLLASLLPADEGKKLEEQFKAASFRAIYREPFAAKTLKAAEKFEDLTPDQRKRVRQIAESYARELRAANDRWAAAQERAEVAGKAHAFPVLMRGGDGHETPTDLAEARTARRELDKRTGEQLAEVLDDEQEARLPKRSETVAGVPGMRGRRVAVMAQDDGEGGGGIVVVADEDAEMEGDGEEGEDVIVHQVIVEQREAPPAPAPPK